jgi:phytoene dehydrogenase-like protein
LSKKGYKILIIEKNEKLGGLVNCASSLNGFSSKILDDLKINLPKLNYNSYVVALNTDQQHTILQENNNKINFIKSNASGENQKKFLSLINKYKIYASTLSNFMYEVPPRLKSGNSKDTWQLINMGWKIRKLGKKNMREFLRVIGLNIADELEDNLSDNTLMGLLAHEAILGSNLGPRSPGSVLSLLYRQAIQNGLFVSEKYDFHQLIPSLEKICHNQGVEIKNNASVKKIITTNNQASGVILDNEEKIDAGIIISNADPKTTYFSLLGTEPLDTDFIRRAKNIRTKGNIAKLTITLKENPIIRNIDKEKMNAKFIYAPDINYIERAFNASKYNKYNENLCFEFHHCVNVIVANIYYVPYVKNNTHDKEKLIQHSINSLKPFISNLEIERAELLTPNAIEEKYNVTGGHWHHGDFEIDQMLMMRPFYGSAQYTTPIKNLYLCSAGTHPGGGITGINGRNAAKKIMRDKI